MHLIIHTQYYPPEVGAPQTRLHELAVGLIKQGIQVSVLTAMPSYPRGNVYQGYKGWLKTEQLEGVLVIRTAIFPTQSVNLFARLLNYFSFILSSIFFGGLMLKRADYLLTESPPLFLGIAGLLLSHWKRAKWIFNISDLWPESAVELGILRRGSLAHKLSATLEKFLYLHAWAVTGQSKTILKHIQKLFPNKQTYHLTNGVDTGYFQPRILKEKTNKFHVVYAGLHGLAQGLDQVLMAACKFLSTESIDFIFVGEGPEKKRLIRESKKLKLDNVRFLDVVGKDRMPEILRSADILIVPLKIQLTGAVPSKLYEAMSMGKPVILIASGEAATIVNDAKCGIVIEPDDIQGLVFAITDLKSNPIVCEQMGMNGRSAAVQNYDRMLIVDNFSKFLLMGNIQK